MSESGGVEKQLRGAILLALLVVVIIAPLVGVYAFSPFMFISGIAPYQLAVALGVMLAQAIAAAALFLLVFRAQR